MALHEWDGAERRSQIERPPNLHTEEAGRRDADDFKLPLSQRELTPDDIRVGAEFALPERMADDQSRRGAPLLIVRGREDAPQSGFHTQRMEKVATHPKHPGVTHFPTRSEVNAAPAPGGDAGKSLLPLPDLLPNPIGDREVPASARAPARHPFRIREAHFGQFLRRADR